jgi:hypothetical protein
LWTVSILQETHMFTVFHASIYIALRKYQNNHPEKHQHNKLLLKSSAIFSNILFITQAQSLLLRESTPKSVHMITASKDKYPY